MRTPEPDPDAAWVAAYRERAKLVGKPLKHGEVRPYDGPDKVTVERRSPSPWLNLPRVLNALFWVGVALVGLWMLQGCAPTPVNPCALCDGWVRVPSERPTRKHVKNPIILPPLPASALTGELVLVGTDPERGVACYRRDYQTRDVPISCVKVTP